MKIIIDAMSGDNAPGEIVRGAVLAAKTLAPEYEYILVGDSAAVTKELESADGTSYLQSGRITVAHADEVLTMEDDPFDIIKKKNYKSVLDLCSGSGIIAITIKKLFPHLDVYAVEKSDTAFEYLCKNCEHNNAQVNKIHSDLYECYDSFENNYFDHNSPVYGSPFEMMKKYGINFNMAAENIAGNQSSEGAVYSWINSEGHLSNILNGDYTATGIGIYTSPVYGKIYVQLFAD